MSRAKKNKTRLSWRWLLDELKRREVYPVIVGYAIVGWILLQIGEVTFDPLGMPEWVMPTLIVLVVAGFAVLGLGAMFAVVSWTGVAIGDLGADHLETNERAGVGGQPFDGGVPELDQVALERRAVQGLATPLHGLDGLAAGIVALEEATGKPVVWATGQYLGTMEPPVVLDLEVQLPAGSSQFKCGRCLTIPGSCSAPRRG